MLRVRGQGVIFHQSRFEFLAAQRPPTAERSVRRVPAGQRLVVGLAGLILAIVVSTWRGRKLFAIARELWDYRLGFTGERVVGEELNQLLASGFRVFHDVPFDGFNIDHVVIGPPGVYVAETKARRKPTNVEGKDRSESFSTGSPFTSRPGSKERP